MIGLIAIAVVILVVVLSTGYVVRQQHVAIVERLGRFHTITGPGFHVKVPFVDITHDVSLMTEDQHLELDAKTKDNVTVELEVSIQYHVDQTGINMGAESGVYKSFYRLSDPIAQMKDYLADALRSQVPERTLDEVFLEKDDIARAIDEAVAKNMAEYGYVIAALLITSIKLPREVQESMNRIIASKNNRESAQNDAEAARAKTVIAAKAKAEAMAEEGRGIAEQRVAIAKGIKESIDTIKGAQMTSGEANHLFEYTQWIDMMEQYAAKGPATVVLPSQFQEQAGVFDQIVAARQEPAGEAPSEEQAEDAQADETALAKPDRCPGCGAPVKPGDVFCQHCGTKL